MRLTLRYYFRTYWKDYALGIFFLLATNGIAASVPMLIKQIIDSLSHHTPHAAVSLLELLAVLLFTMYAVRILSRFFLIGVGRKIEYDTRMKLYEHLLAMPRSYYDVEQTGELMSRLTNDLTAFRMFMGGGIMLMTNVLLAYATILPMMTFLSWRLTIIAFLMYPFVIVLMRFLSARVKQFSHWVQDELGTLTAIAQENFSGISIIQSYAKEAAESARFYDSAHAYMKASLALVKTRSVLYIVISMVSGISILLVLGEGGREVIMKELGLSGLTAFMLYLERLSWPTASFGWILSSTQQGIAAKERVNKVLEAQPCITDVHADRHIQAVPDGPLSVQNLWYRYENPYQPALNTKPPWVLEDISFTVEPGTLVAIVGPIGSGKTTLLNLLARLYDAPEQSIFFNNTPLKKIPLAVLRRDVTLMPQNTFLFSATIQENIAYVDPELHFEHITQMAQAAQIHEEILQLPQRYTTVIGERGVTLSGGQKQRSTLARTLLAKPKILLLDDPFSSVDAETENAIIEALFARKLLHHRTTIFASQRFSLVSQADQIIVLNARGQIDSIGKHAFLLETSMLYRSLNKSDVEQEAILP